MGKFTIGCKVIRKTGEQGIIIKIMPLLQGCQFYKVSWGVGIVRDEPEANLLPDVQKHKKKSKKKKKKNDKYHDTYRCSGRSGFSYTDDYDAWK